MSQKRIATNYPGVFYREIEGDKPSKPVRMYYIRYRIGGRAGKLIEEPVGKSTQLGAAQAAQIRAERMAGKAPSNKEDRRQKEEAKLKEKGCWTIAKLWEEYKANKPNLKGIVTDDNRFTNYITRRIRQTFPRRNYYANGGRLTSAPYQVRQKTGNRKKCIGAFAARNQLWRQKGTVCMARPITPAL